MGASPRYWPSGIPNWCAADRFQKIGYRLTYELGAPLDRIEGGKHFVPEDHPGPVAAAVESVLERAG